jgi:hypothetical protein
MMIQRSCTILHIVAEVPEELMDKLQAERELHRAHTSRDELVMRLTRAIPADGTVEPLDGLHLHRASTPTELAHGVSRPAFCVIAQGSKSF